MKAKRILISGILLTKVMVAGEETKMRCVKGLPPGTRFLYGYPEANYGIWLVVVHDSFPELKDGELIPEWTPLPEFERID